MGILIFPDGRLEITRLPEQSSTNILEQRAA
jgi:hypothetical protein